ncbi:MAG: hypothetical protein IJW29_03275 [Clostridia bacterium]|nr:hypothetical protein [Clostridia bacterium]
MKKALSLLLSVVMVLGLLPAVALSATAASNVKTNPGGSADRWFKSDLYYDVEDAIKEAPLTIEALVHLPNAPSTNYWKHGILMSAYDSNGTLVMQFGTRDGGRPYLGIRDTSGYWKLYNFNKVTGVGDPWPWADSYTHVAVTIDTAGYVSYYEKGVLKAKISYANGTLPSNLEWRIGGDRTDANEYFFRGGVDYIAMYNEVLTAEEIAANKTAKAWDASKSLIAAWDFSKQTSTGNALLDRSGNGHDLIYTNQSGIKIDTFGTYKFDQSLSGMPETVEAWVFLPDAYNARGGTLFGNRPSSTTGKLYFAFEIEYTGHPSFYYTNTDGTRQTHTFTGADVTTGTWSHVAFVHDAENAEARCYINGEMIGTIAGAGAYHPDMLASICQFGADLQGGLAQRFNGFIKELRVYSDQRTAEEIASDYAGEVDYEDENFVLHFNLTPDVEDNNITDLTGNGNNVTYTQDWWEYEDVSHAKDYAYSVAIVGDTQTVTHHNADKLKNIYQWIIDNKDDKNIQYVIGLGDITEKGVDWGHANNDTEEEKAVGDAQWAAALEAISMMDGVLPYSLLRGEGHDGVERFNEWFGDHEGYTQNIAGYYKEGRIENVYHTFQVGEVNYMILCLDFGAKDDVLAWADEVVAAHPTHRVIVTTHAYMKKDGTLLDSDDAGRPSSSGYDVTNNDGDDIWNKFVRKHANIFMVMCGHMTANDVIVSKQTGDYGNEVTQILVNPQAMDSSNSPKGMVAMFYFSEDGQDVQIEYYSTITGMWRPNKEITVSYGSTEAPSYEGMSEKYVVAQNTETGLYSVIENKYFQFLGGSLRYADATDGYANIRFGYQFMANVDLNATAWKWNYGVAGEDLPSTIMGSNYTANNVTNLVITGVPTEYFASDMESQLVFDVTIDGVTYTVTDRVRTRNVLGIAQNMVKSAYESQTAKDYAQTIIDACAS